ncbi:hypothetical protein A2Z22_03925 [Candidatus Woesebacteria bacterium RBG_16_34_12]|uniref:Uncharacterized protein n=1 Tax=Candidatus Woesebacteria bacterium RBG_16_34_12 TaxID=1802480 RepID=A0A1F7X9D7_9BACT|nr:MAG: hypothetical protein A2Z22_03925 [Candidatus Woesebacteria bacterium RBG_16_34_12]
MTILPNFFKTREYLRNKIRSINFHLKDKTKTIALIVILLSLAIIVKRPINTTVSTVNKFDTNVTPPHSTTLKLEGLTIVIPEKATYPPIHTEITLSGYPSIPRKAEGITPTYEFTVTLKNGEVYKEFNQPFTISIDYKNHNLEEVKEDTIAIYYAGDNSEWIKLNSQSDKANKIATATSTLTGNYALMGDIKFTPQPLGYTKQEYPISEWKEFISNEYNFSIKYPPNWTVSTPDELKNQMAIFSVNAMGDIQGARQIGTELFDGISISVHVANKFSGTIDDWIKGDNLTSEEIISKSQETIGGNNFTKLVMGGYMGGEDYIFNKNGWMYTISYYVVGVDKEIFDKIGKEVLSTFNVLN